MLRILQQEAPVLREIAKPVAISDISSPKIKLLLKEMRETLANEHDGVGLAAPQVGHSLRVFIVSDLVFRHQEDTEKEQKKNSAEKAAAETAVPATRPLVYINPVITAKSKDKKSLEEGCLSVRPLYGTVKRASKVTIRAHDENGQLFERGASGLLAQIFQHEVDHLNGTLFIDTAKNVHIMEEVEEEK